MKKKFKCFIILFCLQNSLSFLGQGGALSCNQLQNNFTPYQSCATSIPFTNQTTNNSEGIDPSCFAEDIKAPTWFFIKIKTGGDINLQISQVSNLGNPIDVDFCLWGPFTSLTNGICNQLNASSEVACSWSDASVEDCLVPNAIAGQYYILVVDNFVKVPGQITITQLAGTGNSDCGFLSSVKIKDISDGEISDTDYCKPAVKDLKAIVDVTDFTANPANLRFNYRWSLNGNVVYSLNNSLLNSNIYSASQTGIYKVEIAAYDVSDPSVDVNNVPFLADQNDDITLNFFDVPTLKSAPVVLSQCDLETPNNDGFTTFNLTQLYNEITNNTAGIVLKYYKDIALSEQILNPIAFVNTISTNQSVFVVGNFQGQAINCPSNITEIKLIATPTSLNTYPDILPVCPSLNFNYGFVDFALQRQNIKNTYFPTATVTIDFYGSQTDASLEQNALNNLSQISVGSNLIYTKVKSGTNCNAVGTFVAQIKAAPNKNNINNVSICQLDVFKLNQKDAEVLLGQANSVSCSYHNTFDDAKNNQNNLDKNVGYIGNLGANTVYVRVFDAVSQCFSVIDFKINIFSNPTVNQNPTDYKVCGIGKAFFNLNSRISDLVGVNNFIVTFFESQNDLTNNNPIANPSNFESVSKTIFVKVSDAANNNCTATTKFKIIVLDNIASTTNPSAFLFCDDTGFKNVDLKTKEVEMAGNSNVNDLIFKYYESKTEAENNSNNFIQNPSNYTNATKNYQKIYVRISDVNPQANCVTILEIEIFVSPLPPNNLLQSPYKICANKDGIIIKEAIVDTKLIPQLYKFEWFTGSNAVAANILVGETKPDLITEIEGNFSVKITDLNSPSNCSSVINFSTKIYKTPSNILISPDEIIAFNEQNLITIIANPPSLDYEYLLNFGFWQKSNVFENLKPGLNTVFVRNSDACETISKTIFVADFNRFFTPNGDSFNDFWKIEGDEALDKTETFVFDRYGKLVYQHKKASQGWDGTFNGVAMPADDYWFKIIYTNKGENHEFKGNFSLKR